MVENNSTEQKTFEGYEDIKRTYPDKVQIIEWQHPFNYSAINNFGVKHAKGEYLLFLNNDTEAINGDLLQELLGEPFCPVWVQSVPSCTMKTARSSTTGSSSAIPGLPVTR